MKPAIAETVLSRANHACEVCGSTRNIELDHFAGKARAPDSEDTIWALCRACHRNKTDSYPTAEWWLERWIQHCVVYGYEAAAVRARNRLVFVSARNALLPFGRKAGGV